MEIKKRSMKLKLKRILIAHIFIWGLVFTAIGQEIPKQDGFVVDQANLFSSKEIQYLKNELQAFSDTTSNQIVVVTMTDLQGYEPFEVATRIGVEWGVGQKGMDNGVVILIKPKTQQSKGRVFISPGYGLEGAIPDATAKMIVEREMIPYFKRRQMFEGVETAIGTIKSLAVGEYNSDQYAKGNELTAPWFPFLMFFVIFVFIILSKYRAAKTYSVGNNLPFWTALMLMNQGRGHGGHYNNFTSGGGGFGGGGFGGFGGGGFGGGGAGGSW